jgi:predicted DNA-binding transcriptional regulator AlpA
MSEKLLTPIQAARMLGVSRSKFYGIRHQLMARGMKRITVGKNHKYLESSIERLIRIASESGKPLA